MGMFDYKNYDEEKSKSIFSNALNLVSHAQDVAKELPPGWKKISAKELDYDVKAGAYEARKALVGEHDTYGERGTFFGEKLEVLTAQVDISGQYDAQGKLVAIGIVFQGSRGAFGDIDSIIDFVASNARAMNDHGFSIEYPYLAFEKLLSAVANFAKQNGLTGENITITGASLGGMAVNGMADLSETRWGGSIRTPTTSDLYHQPYPRHKKS
ncbi:hypothetical protein [Pseudomonas chlororaphis]|uniref:Lipase n=1 Tax=Pseudomonas chlororaphis TaxID=587753 RepID=A0AAX3FTH4_9PSED|nr:hypothetical protein [Pseudomonas chlororaphis]AZC38890.1 Lipase [Pseudomonas chlororaphis subsp. piscium]AZC45440.1 Lipase [Pseudomonas chlororaphis subsp. piscium]WDG71003.1 hypothetical protein PUP65_23205 [Pseudomonas chlororaphis]WDH31211.1 hypothetical protein PUP81_11115 [Pseudomonas chlororaphis]WDH69529.1 hypothetical protein PUP78_23190 [Pseudomonas chlororaphis]